MKEPYSYEVSDVLQEARKIAVDAGSSTIESEHVLMAIIRMVDSEGRALLQERLGISTLTSMRLYTEKVINSHSARVAVEGQLYMSVAMVNVLQKLQSVYNATSKDLLIALSLENGCTAASILDRYGFSQDSQSKQAKPKVSMSEAGATPALDAFSMDMTKLASEGKLDPIVNRFKEINRISEILGRRKKNNPVLIGEPGVGKSAIIEGLANKIASGDVPEALQGKRIVSLNMASVVAGTKLRGQFEERIKAILDELIKNRDIILFIDEVHTLIGSGGPEGTGDAANMFKPALARGEIQCIGATTYDDYRKYIERDPALERRFQRITVEPPTISETVSILAQIKPIYEEFHGLKYDAAIPGLAAQLADRYITDRHMPDKAIDIFDEAGSVAKLTKQLFVSEETVRQVVSTMTGVPVTSIGQSERDRLKTLAERLNSVVLGQEEAINVLVKAVKRSRTGIKNTTKPFTALLLGPTGTGKTETAKQLAKCLFDSEDALIRQDMSELSEQHAVAKLIGAPPGYIGYESGGKLTEAVKKRPYSIILLDEIEKAHPEVFNLFLQVFDDGVLTDGRGKVVNFKNTIILMTSNIGTQEAAKSSLGFLEGDEKAVQDDKRNRALKDSFRPEFLNRIDQVVHYSSLTKAAIHGILKIYIQELHGISISLTDAAVDYFATKGYSKEFGARPLRRLVQDKIETPIADFMLDDPDCKSYQVDVSDETVHVTKIERTEQ